MSYKLPFEDEIREAFKSAQCPKCEEPVLGDGGGLCADCAGERVEVVETE